MRVVVGWQGPERNAASTNTMSRFETEMREGPSEPGCRLGFQTT